MLTCPMCKKKLRRLEKECLNCRTDVSLLVNYVEDLRDGVAQAEALNARRRVGRSGMGVSGRVGGRSRQRHGSPAGWQGGHGRAPVR